MTTIEERKATLTWKKCYEIVRDNPRHIIAALQSDRRNWRGRYGYCAVGAILHYVYPKKNLKVVGGFGGSLLDGMLRGYDSLSAVGRANDAETGGGSPRQRALTEIATHLTKEELTEVKS